MVYRTFISPDELYPGRVITYTDVATLAATLNRTECLKFLAYMNLVLSNATTAAKLANDLAPVRDVQHWLFREMVGAQLLRDLKEKFHDASLLNRPLLHR